MPALSRIYHLSPADVRDMTDDEMTEYLADLQALTKKG